LNDHGTCFMHGKKYIAVVDGPVSSVIPTVHRERITIRPIAAGGTTKKDGSSLEGI
jgi:hypothetical protein